MTKKTQKKLRKALLLISCAALLVCITVGVTVAYLTDSESVKNTFTVGNVELTLVESQVNLDGTKTGEVITDGGKNEYKLMPGHEYIKDPTVTVIEGSEDSYVRMIVTVNDLTKLQKAFPKTVEANAKYWNGDVFLLQMLVDWNESAWAFAGIDSTNTKYEFRYVGAKATDGVVTTDGELEKLFTKIIMPDDIENAELAELEGLEIDIEAHAIQADGFADANAAWTAFEAE